MKLITRPIITNLELPVGASVEIHSGFDSMVITKGKILKSSPSKFTVGVIDPIDDDDEVLDMYSDCFEVTYDDESKRITRVYLIDDLIEDASGELTVINVRDKPCCSN